ncbi:hypothetical protein ACG7TL_008469 [Trametes sanguinea]
MASHALRWQDVDTPETMRESISKSLRRKSLGTARNPQNWSGNNEASSQMWLKANNTLNVSKVRAIGAPVRAVRARTTRPVHTQHHVFDTSLSLGNEVEQLNRGVKSSSLEPLLGTKRVNNPVDENGVEMPPLKRIRAPPTLNIGDVLSTNDALQSGPHIRDIVPTTSANVFTRPCARTYPPLHPATSAAVPHEAGRFHAAGHTADFSGAGHALPPVPAFPTIVASTYPNLLENVTMPSVQGNKTIGGSSGPGAERQSPAHNMSSSPTAYFNSSSAYSFTAHEQTAAFQSGSPFRHDPLASPSTWSATNPKFESAPRLGTAGPPSRDASSLLNNNAHPPSESAKAVWIQIRGSMADQSVLYARALTTSPSIDPGVDRFLHSGGDAHSATSNAEERHDSPNSASSTTI